jgi:hypothetical protein
MSLHGSVVLDEIPLAVALDHGVAPGVFHLAVHRLANAPGVTTEGKGTTSVLSIID